MAFDPIEHHVVHEHVAPETVATRRRFGVAQAIALIAGIFFVVLGVVGLARTGIHSWTGTAVYVGPFRATTLLALIHLVVGLVFLVEMPSWFGARGVCMALAPVLIAFGIVALIQPIAALGWVHANGWLYIVTGVVSLIVGLLTPSAVVSRGDVVV